MVLDQTTMWKVVPRQKTKLRITALLLPQGFTYSEFIFSLIAPENRQILHRFQ